MKMNAVQEMSEEVNKVREKSWSVRFVVEIQGKNYVTAIGEGEMQTV